LLDLVFGAQQFAAATFLPKFTMYSKQMLSK